MSLEEHPVDQSEELLISMFFLTGQCKDETITEFKKDLLYYTENDWGIQDVSIQEIHSFLLFDIKTNPSCFQKLQNREKYEEEIKHILLNYSEERSKKRLEELRKSPGIIASQISMTNILVRLFSNDEENLSALRKKYQEILEMQIARANDTLTRMMDNMCGFIWDFPSTDVDRISLTNATFNQISGGKKKSQNERKLVIGNLTMQFIRLMFAHHYLQIIQPEIKKTLMTLKEKIINLNPHLTVFDQSGIIESDYSIVSEIIREVQPVTVSVLDLLASSIFQIEGVQSGITEFQVNADRTNQMSLVKFVTNIVSFDDLSIHISTVEALQGKIIEFSRLIQRFKTLVKSEDNKIIPIELDKENLLDLIWSIYSYLVFIRILLEQY